MFVRIHVCLDVGWVGWGEVGLGQCASGQGWTERGGAGLGVWFWDGRGSAADVMALCGCLSLTLFPFRPASGLIRGTAMNPTAIYSG